MALQYYTKLKSCPFNPAYDCIFNTEHKQQFEQKEKNPFGLQMESILQESAISVTNVHKSILPQIPPFNHLKTTSNPPIKQTPQNKNTFQRLSGKISHYPLIILMLLMAQYDSTAYLY